MRSQEIYWVDNDNIKDLEHVFFTFFNVQVISQIKVLYVYILPVFHCGHCYTIIVFINILIFVFNFFCFILVLVILTDFCLKVPMKSKLKFFVFKYMLALSLSIS